MEGGRVDNSVIKDYGETAVGGAAGTNAGASYTIDISSGNFFNLILNANCTFTYFKNALASGSATSFTLVLKQDATGGRTVTWPANVYWPGNMVPTLTPSASRYDVFTFHTFDAGSSWVGMAGGFNFLRTYIFLTSTATTPTWTVPADWNSSNNSIECIGGGGSGGSNGNNTVGGGGGGYSKITNLSLTGGASVTYQVGAGGAAVGPAVLAGNAGGDTWFNSASFPSSGSAVGAKGGSGGGTGGSAALGGQASAGYAPSGTKYDGGTATFTGGNSSNSGGGAGGPNGAGGASTSTMGGTGGNGSGGPGADAGRQHGGTGFEWDPTHGSGGGGFGANSSNVGTVGNGGLYGGGGGAHHALQGPSGAGARGIIVISYTP